MIDPRTSKIGETRKITSLGGGARGQDLGHGLCQDQEADRAREA